MFTNNFYILFSECHDKVVDIVTDISNRVDVTKLTLLPMEVFTGGLCDFYIDTETKFPIIRVFSGNDIMPSNARIMFDIVRKLDIMIMYHTVRGFNPDGENEKIIRSFISLVSELLKECDINPYAINFNKWNCKNMPNNKHILKINGLDLVHDRPHMMDKNSTEYEELKNITHMGFIASFNDVYTLFIGHSINGIDRPSAILEIRDNVTVSDLLVGVRDILNTEKLDKKIYDMNISDEPDISDWLYSEYKDENIDVIRPQHPETISSIIKMSSMMMITFLMREIVRAVENIHLGMKTEED